MVGARYDYDRSLYKKRIIMKETIFSPSVLPPDLGTWKTLKRINRGHQNFNGLYLINVAFIDKVYMKHL